MFSAPNRTAQIFDTIAAAALEAQYSERGTATATAFDEVTLTIAWKISGLRVRVRTRAANAFVKKNMAFAFTSRQRSQLSSETSSGSPRCRTPTPALLTSVVSGPRAASIASSAASCLPRSATSKGAATAATPIERTSRTAFRSGSSSSGPLSATAKPSAANAFAAASPIPRLAPDTNTACPVMTRLRA